MFLFSVQQSSPNCLVWFQERQRVAACNHLRHRLEIAKISFLLHGIGRELELNFYIGNMNL